MKTNMVTVPKCLYLVLLTLVPVLFFFFFFLMIGKSGTESKLQFEHNVIHNSNVS